jgi:UDP-N-acetylmuramate dehydrogenase
MDIKQENLSKWTSLRVGGKSDIYTPKSVSELQNFLKHNIKNLLFLGLGSNMLPSDNGFDGVVIRTKHLNEISIQNNTITAYCGVTLAKLAKVCSQHNQLGANFLATIPGSVGGGLCMNAGCFGKEIWQGVEGVQTIDNEGNIHSRTIDDFKILYRNVVAAHNGEYFLSAHFHFDNNAVNIKTLQQRYDSQPIGTANCGSVFKNPKGLFAAKLIEDAGLKGTKEGGAEISTKHANFIINTGSATSRDIKILIEKVQTAVEQKFGISLETEVKIY